MPRRLSCPVLVLVFALLPFATVAAARETSDPEVAVLEASDEMAIFAGEGRYILGLRHVARRFHETYDVSPDLLIVASSFPTTDDEGARYQPVANAVRGVNAGRGDRNPALFDNSADYGSAALRGIVVLGSVAELPDDPDEPFRGTPRAVDLLGQEFAHQFGAFVRFRDSSGDPSGALLGRDGAHWSFFVDTGGSVLGGNAWGDEGPPWTTMEPRGGFAALDLYLLGLVPAEDVPPTRFLADAVVLSDRVPPWTADDAPAAGVTVGGTFTEVDIASIVAVEGPRDPPAGAQSWHHAFVLLELPGDPAGPEAIGRFDVLRRRWQAYLVEATGGRAAVRTSLGPAASGVAPATEGCGCSLAPIPAWRLLMLRRS